MRLFKFSEEVTLKNNPLPFFTVLVIHTVLVTLLSPAPLRFRHQPGPESGVVEADECSVTSRAGEIIRSSHIHLNAGANVPTRVLAELHVCGADAVVIQTEGEAAAARRLRLRAVSPAPAGHVP